ncbi:hypothetical protein HYH03_012059 [Edaphochlamys debaryana]|uniref:Uncharacterized protein n=1 Tax=Edaphochlamys debaryana TaxID=47281 RepID=A0A835XSS1_9CHLO|nr:hypothetical protein HYH03_012059 [Edaphochlamys debaryana]|eukprot:KAG2489421.1 hypothetical protein HYH03_012059 [Edaphochlamys debaryana]
MGSGLSKSRKTKASDGTKDAAKEPATKAVAASTNSPLAPPKPSVSTPPQSAPLQQQRSLKTALSNGSVSGSSAAEPEHSPAPPPVNEAERFDYLCGLNVLDTEPEKRYDDITRLCCLVFKCPIALVSLVDKDRQWFKSVQGLTVRQTPRSSSFCAWTLLPEHPEVLVVENALEDIRFRNNPLVLGPPHIRFYAGCPLVAANGMRLGSLCVIDNKPRAFDAESCNMLANMAEMVIREIEKDTLLEQQKARSELLTQQNSQLIRALDCFQEGIMLVNMSLPTWPILFVNEAWEKTTSISKDSLTGDTFWASFTTPDGTPESTRLRLSSAVEAQESFSLTVRHTRSDTGGSVPGAASGGRRTVTLQFRSAHTSTVDNYMPLVGIPSILAASPAAGGPMYYFATLSGAGSRSSSDLASGSSSHPAFSITTSKLDPFDDVKLGPLLGKGAYGRVYRGVWNGAQVAVKVLETVQQDDSAQVLEAVLGGTISHPNIVQTYKHSSRPMGTARDADNEGRTVLETWMVLEFCNKGGLADAIERGWFRKRHSLFEVDYKSLILTAREVAAAMTYLHSRNILHGDLTGSNVLLTASDRDERHFTAKVADFGLSRVLQGEAITTRSYGTITHMSPELLVDGLLTKSADVYSFGVIMWEMYTGQRPYGGLTHGQILHAITTGKPLPLGASCPQPMKEFLTRLLTPKHAERPAFTEIIPMLDELMEELV